MTLKFQEFRTIIESGGGRPAGKYEFLDLDVVKAKSIAKSIIAGSSLDFNKTYPNFDYNFLKIKSLLSTASGRKRKEMPVISSYQVDDFHKHLVKNKIKSIYKWQPIGSLKPIQSQVYFDKAVNAEIEFGGIKHGSEQTKKTVIVSKDGYIIDGHHRWATGVLADESVKIRTLVVDMDIEELLDYAREYGESIGNKPNK